MDAVEQQRSLLATHREALHHLLQQQAQFGAHTPEYVAIGITQRRAEIARIKALLRGWGAAADDHTDDEEHPTPTDTDAVYDLRDPALIATFYGQRGKLQPLANHLAQHFELTQENATTFANDATATWLLHFDVSAAPDTSVVQLALNDTAPPAATWPALRAQLEAALDDARLRWPVWGYTLVYQAMLVQAPDPHVPMGQALLPTLATSALPGGLLSLHHLPLLQDGLEAATVYAALSLPDPTNQMVKQVLVDAGALLLLPDLVAHKSYHQMRQYRSGDWLPTYNRLVEELRDTTRQVLTAPATAAQRAALERATSAVAARVQDLRALRLSLTQQQENFPWWVNQALGDTAVVQVHQQHLVTALRDMELLVEKGQAAVEGARAVRE